MDAASKDSRLQAGRDSGVLMQRIVLWMRQSVCRHKFRLGDQSLTGIPEPEKPAPSDYFGWKKYYSSLSEHPSHTRRLKWPCAKCGKMFYEHCGLDVLSKHGEILPQNAEVSEVAVADSTKTSGVRPPLSLD